MSRGKEKPYEDILQLPRHVSGSHPPMPLPDRAAQFSPFSALSGYEEAVREEGRITGERKELNEDAKKLLDEKLQAILARGKDAGETVFTCFRADARKEGGACIVLEGRVKKWEPCERSIILTDGTRIPATEIVDIQNVTVNG